MKKFLLFLIFALNISVSFGYKELINKDLDGKNIKIIKVVLDGKTKIVTAVSQNGDTFENLVKSQGGDAGINGAYFCPADYPQCNGSSRTNVDRVYQGTQMFKYKGDFGSRGMFGFDKDGKPLFVMNNEGCAGGYVKQYNNDKMDQLYYGISNHPVLLLEGDNVLSNSESLIDVKMKKSSYKSFICSTQDNKTIYMGNISDLTIYELPGFIKKNFGCYNAIGLDNGGSLGFMYGSKVYNKPGRKIMDAFVVVDVVSNSNNDNSNIPSNVNEDKAIIQSIIYKFKKVKAKKLPQQKIQSILSSIKDIMKSKDAYSQKLQKINIFLDAFVGEV